MEDNEVKHEEDKLGAAWARTKSSGNAIIASAITKNGKTAAAIMSIIQGDSLKLIFFMLLLLDN